MTTSNATAADGALPGPRRSGSKPLRDRRSADMRLSATIAERDSVWAIARRTRWVERAGFVKVADRTFEADRRAVAGPARSRQRRPVGSGWGWQPASDQIAPDSRPEREHR